MSTGVFSKMVEEYKARRAQSPAKIELKPIKSAGIEGKLENFGFSQEEILPISIKLTEALKPYGVAVNDMLRYMLQDFKDKSYVLHLIASEPFRNVLVRTYKVKNA